MAEIELCWNITASCNQACKYCHRFLYPCNLSLEQNQLILNKLHQKGIKKITWTGGELLTYPQIEVLLKQSHEFGIENKIVTNGLWLNEEFAKQTFACLNRISFSIDSLSPLVNEKLGRGAKHGDTFLKVVALHEKYGKHIGLSINSVATAINLDDLFDLGAQIKHLPVDEWRIFQFMPLRDLAKVNKEMFLIEDETYQKEITNLKQTFPNINIVTRDIQDFEKKYVLILANADVVVTKNGQDEVIGNMLDDNFNFCV